MWHFKWINLKCFSIWWFGEMFLGSEDPIIWRVCPGTACPSGLTHMTMTKYWNLSLMTGCLTVSLSALLCGWGTPPGNITTNCHKFRRFLSPGNIITFLNLVSGNQKGPRPFLLRKVSNSNLFLAIFFTLHYFSFSWHRSKNTPFIRTRQLV